MIELSCIDACVCASFCYWVFSWTDNSFYLTNLDWVGKSLVELITHKSKVKSNHLMHLDVRVNLNVLVYSSLELKAKDHSLWFQESNGVIEVLLRGWEYNQTCEAFERLGWQWWWAYESFGVGNEGMVRVREAFYGVKNYNVYIVSVLLV